MEKHKCLTNSYYNSYGEQVCEDSCCNIGFFDCYCGWTKLIKYEKTLIDIGLEGIKKTQSGEILKFCTMTFKNYYYDIVMEYFRSKNIICQFAGDPINPEFMIYKYWSKNLLEDELLDIVSKKNMIENIM